MLKKLPYAALVDVKKREQLNPCSPVPLLKTYSISLELRANLQKGYRKADRESS